MTSEKSPVALLNDIRQDAVYECISDQGSTPEKRITFKLVIDGKTFFGSGPSKKEAKAASAACALKHPAVNVNANLYKSKEGQNQNFHASKQASIDKKPKKESQGRIANYNENNDGQRVCSLFLNSKCSPVLQNSPSLSPQVPLNDSLTWLQFCDYYRHLRCQFADCKFLHVSTDDEEFYVANRRIPAHIVEQAVLKALAADQTPGISPCKRFMEGQCSRIPCPYRHISRRQFAQEVIEILNKHFEKLLPREDYHMNSRRHLGSLGLDRVSAEGMSYENRCQNMMNYGHPKPSLADPDDFVKGMKNLMRNNYYRENELHDLRDELNMLHEENAMLKNSYRLRVTESQRMESEDIYQERIRRLRKENDDIRRMLLKEKEKRQQPFYSIQQSNTDNSDGFCFDMIPNLRQQYPEMSCSDELLDSGIQRMESQIRYTRLGMPTSLPTQHSQVHKQAMQQFAKQRQQQEPVYNASRMTYKTAQPPKRPTYQLNQKSNIAQPKKANQQPNLPQKQQQNQKSFPPKKESKQKKNDSNKDNPVIKTTKTAQPRRKPAYYLNRKSNIAQPKKANQKPSPSQKEQQKSSIPKKESKQKKNDSCKDNPVDKTVNTNHESTVKEQGENESKKNLGVKINPIEEKTHSKENVKAEESLADCNLQHPGKRSDGEIKESDEEIFESDEEIKVREEETKERDEEIKERDEEIKERDEEIKERDEEIKERDEEIKERDEEIKESDEEIKKSEPFDQDDYSMNEKK